ncbi:hypothetical protein GEMRC1_003363 [Eukaryota sp. GEM-RC1]
MSLTGFDASSAKLSAIRAGYYNDPYLELFVPKSKQLQYDPIMHRGYYVRVASLRKTFDDFVKLHNDNFQVINIGCGFDTVSLRYLLNPSNTSKSVKFLEIDLPDIVRRKSSVLMTQFQDSLYLTKTRSPTGLCEVHSDRYHLLPADAEDPNTIEQCFSKCGITSSLPTFIVFECLLVYLDPDRVDSTIRFLSHFFQSSLVYVYDPVRPHTPFGRNMVRHISDKVGTPLTSLEKYPNLNDNRRRFYEAGFENVASMDLYYIDGLLLDDSERSRLQSLEPFPEIEEYQYIQSQYMVLIAGHNHDLGSLSLNLKLTDKDEPGIHKKGN